MASDYEQISEINVLPVAESGAVIEQMMCSTAFVKITAVYGQIDENWEFVRKMRFDYGQIGQNGQKRPFVRKIRFAYGQISKKWCSVRKYHPSVTESSIFWLFSSQQELVMHTQNPF